MNIRIANFVLFLNMLICATCSADSHLVIMSGQSNMGRMDPSISLKPIVREALAGDEVEFIKMAWGGRSIDKWYPNGALYDKLMEGVQKTMKNKSFDTVSFVWMQGEADTQKTSTAETYKANLTGLINTVKSDLKRDDLHVVIGRLNDARESDPVRAPDWLKVKKAQVEFADEYKSGAWINTDDCNVDTGVHNTDDGYKKMGIRFGSAIVKLIKGDSPVIDEDAFSAHAPDGKDTYTASLDGKGGNKKKDKKKGKKKAKKK
jgi:hypothetical protein